ASEALLRWENPEKGLLFPSRFLRAAEESGLILPIGGWVLKQACRDAVAWGKQIGQEFGLAVNVNVSARQFAEPNFTRQVNDALIESGLAPKQLRLEITEAGVMETGEEAIDKLRTLKDSGVRVYLDDFGTGYSSLKYLQRLPIDGIKIDRSFTSQLDSEERTLGISKVILQMGEMFGLDVTAEGVETERQLELLTDLSCPTAQGNYFCRPMSSEAFSVFLALRSENDRESNVINFRKPTPTV
ncbi:MAG: EAL domain-containing protein, partial [Acidobacteriota bacterium]